MLLCKNLFIDVEERKRKEVEEKLKVFNSNINNNIIKVLVFVDKVMFVVNCSIGKGGN